MKRRLFTLCIALVALPAAADTLVAARTIRAMSVLTPEDLSVTDSDVPGALKSVSDALGMEARTILYQGRPILPEDIGPAATVERNALVTLVYNRGHLRITAEGRALGRGGPGDRIRILNLASRTTVTGTVDFDGTVAVGEISRP